MRALRLLGCVLVASACQDNIATPFPAGLEPFDDDAEVDSLELPADETLASIAVDRDLIRAYGRGRIAATPDALFAAALDPEVMVAVCSTTSHSASIGNEPEYTLSYLVRYFVDDILDVEWDDQWRGDERRDALGFMIKHQKVQGSDFVRTSEGSVAFVAIGDGDTEVRFVEHLDAVSATTADVLAGMQHNYAALRAAANGQARPSCASATIAP